MTPLNLATREKVATHDTLLPSRTRGFDSLLPLQVLNNEEGLSLQVSIKVEISGLRGLHQNEAIGTGDT